MNAERNSPWDIFIHLLAAIAVYATVYATISLLFSYVNLAFPDPLDSSVSISDNVRYAMAILFVFFPAYCWAWRSIETDLAQNPWKRPSWLRTCPIYLTVFLAGLLLFGDLACLIYYFLGGDLTVRFALKVISIVLIAGVVLLFYRDALRSEPNVRSRRRQILSYGSCSAVAALIVVGMAVGGSPGKARLERFDAAKINDLDAIQSKVLEYWESKGTLPRTLSDLSDVMTDYSPPRDPQNNAAYGYHATGPTSFQLCADFNLLKQGAGRDLVRWKKNDTENWDHGAGNVCFARTIDPERHRPKSATAS
ncbi:MAG: DUF5671 domain-containing protein [Candidatus Binataceae bacterium]